MANHLFHRHTTLAPPVAVAGDGMYIVDSQGDRYLDGSGGAAVSALGHSDQQVRLAINDQLGKIAYAHTSFFTTEAAEKLADQLVDSAPRNIKKVYLVSGGSEGVEAAIKMARQYFVARGQSQRHHFIARQQSYHGSTLGALSVSGNHARRAPYVPLLFEVRHIAPCYSYRHKKVAETEEDYGVRVADELEQALLELGPDKVAGFIAEPVVGATAGALPATKTYFPRIREICDKYGVLLILDEVMCGTGRTGTLHACEQENVSPDLLVAAKGLGAGYQPIGAVLVAGHIFETIKEGVGFFQHGHTYIGHATACAAALAVQRAIEQRQLLSNVRKMGQLLKDLLSERFQDHAYVGDIRGRGLFRAVELVRDKRTKEPFDPESALYAQVKRESMARRLIIYPGGGTADGKKGDHVLIAPPFIADEKHIHQIVDRVGEAIDASILQIQQF